MGGMGVGFVRYAHLRIGIVDGRIGRDHRSNGLVRLLVGALGGRTLDDPLLGAFLSLGEQFGACGSGRKG